MRLRDMPDSEIAAVMSAWSRQANSPSAQTSTLLPPTIVRARLLAACSPASGDWLDALPLSSVELKMDNATVHIAAGLRLGAPVVQLHVCVCGSMVTVDGHHGLSCRHGSGRFSECNLINELLCRAFVSAGNSRYVNLTRYARTMGNDQTE
jgi:hypothetical protein